MWFLFTFETTLHTFPGIFMFSRISNSSAVIDLCYALKIFLRFWWKTCIQIITDLASQVALKAPWDWCQIYAILCNILWWFRCKTAVSPLLTHWRYCSLSLTHQYNIAYSKVITKGRWTIDHTFCWQETMAPSQYKDRLIYVWRFPC